MERLAGRIILLWGWRRALVAFLAGALAVLSQAPYDFFAVCFVSFPVLIWLLDGASVSAPAGFLRRVFPTFVVGWWFGFGYFLAGLWWIGNALLVQADSAWALPLAVLVIPAVQALFYGFATAVARLVWSNSLGRIAALAFAFGLAEWLRTFMFSGFPWNAIGYAAMPMPILMQSVSAIGMMGVNTLAVFVFAMPALLASHRGVRLGFALAVLLVAAHVGFGYFRLSTPLEPDGRSLSVRIVQPAIDMQEKWDDAAQDKIFASMLELSAKPPAEGQPKPQFILWPETAVPFLFTERPDALAAIGELLGDGQMLVTGAARSEGGRSKDEERYYNSVVAIDDAGEIVDAVDKNHLVPFGEYMPFSDLLARFGLEKLVTAPMDFAAGNERHAIKLPGGIGALPFICYEIIFPDIAKVDVTSSDIIVNVTNDAWFGNTPGPFEHFRQAQVRAVEAGLPMLRAANNGISAVVDQRGRVLDALALNARGVIDTTISFYKPDPLRLGNSRLNGFAILSVLAFFAVGLSLMRRWKAN